MRSSNFRMFTKVTPFLALCKCYVQSLLFAQLQLHMEKLTYNVLVMGCKEFMFTAQPASRISAASLIEIKGCEGQVFSQGWGLCGA